jgi:hypothetical protein
MGQPGFGHQHPQDKPAIAVNGDGGRCRESDRSFQLGAVIAPILLLSRPIISPGLSVAEFFGYSTYLAISRHINAITTIFSLWISH